MYKDYKKYPNLPKLPNDLEDALKKLNNKKIKNLFGEKVINSYLKLKNSELNDFKEKDKFDKTKSITKWEKANTLDC